MSVPVLATRAGIALQPGRDVLADVENFATGGGTILIWEDARPEGRVLGPRVSRS